MCFIHCTSRLFEDGWLFFGIIHTVWYIECQSWVVTRFFGARKPWRTFFGWGGFQKPCRTFFGWGGFRESRHGFHRIVKLYCLDSFSRQITLAILKFFRQLRNANIAASSVTLSSPFGEVHETAFAKAAKNAKSRLFVALSTSHFNNQTNIMSMGDPETISPVHSTTPCHY